MKKIQLNFYEVPAHCVIKAMKTIYNVNSRYNLVSFEIYSSEEQRDRGYENKNFRCFYRGERDRTKEYERKTLLQNAFEQQGVWFKDFDGRMG